MKEVWEVRKVWIYKQEKRTFVQSISILPTVCLNPALEALLTLPYLASSHSPIGTNGERFRGNSRKLWDLAARDRQGVGESIQPADERGSLQVKIGLEKLNSQRKNFGASRKAERFFWPCTDAGESHLGPLWWMGFQSDGLRAPCAIQVQCLRFSWSRYATRAAIGGIGCLEGFSC